MYYVVNAAGQTEGPYSAEWIRANASPTTMVSHQQQWLAFQSHPDFRDPSLVVRGDAPCAACDVARSQGQQFCTTCGRPVAVAATSKTMSPHLALINLIIPGLAQIAFGQVAKGVIIVLAFIVTVPTIFIAALVVILSIVDGYLVGGRLRRTGHIDPWAFFPS